MELETVSFPSEGDFYNSLDEVTIYSQGIYPRQKKQTYPLV